MSVITSKIRTKKIFRQDVSKNLCTKIERHLEVRREKRKRANAVRIKMPRETRELNTSTSEERADTNNYERTSG